MVPEPNITIDARHLVNLRGRFALPVAIVVLHVAILAIYVVMARGHGGFFKAVCTWDCWWYTMLVQIGYFRHAIAGPEFAGQANWGFFPLYPLLSRLFCAVTGANVARGPIIFNLLLLPFMVWMSVNYGLRRKIIGNAGCAMLVLLAAPWGIYFRTGYTETLYGLLLIGSLWLAEDWKFWPTCLCLALVALTRPTGILVALVTSIAYAVRQRGDGRSVRKRLFDSALLLMAGGVGLGSFMFYLYLHVGDPLAFVHVQAAFFHHAGNPFGYLLGGLMQFDLLTLTNYNAQSEFLKAFMAVLATLLMAWLAWRGLYTEAAIVLLTLLVAASSGLVAMPRYLFANPLTLLALSSLIERFPPPARILSLTGLAAAQVGFIFLWYHNATVLV
jgi:hypothetical protein